MTTQIRNPQTLSQAQVLPWYALWCIQAHGTQMYGRKPYRAHLEAVAKLAVRYGFTAEQIIMVCWLHDVLEDCPDQSVQTLLAAGFPPEVVAAAYALKDEDGATRDEKKAKTLPKIAANRMALIVKLCDASPTCFSAAATIRASSSVTSMSRSLSRPPSISKTTSSFCPCGSVWNACWWTKRSKPMKPTLKGALHRRKSLPKSS